MATQKNKNWKLIFKTPVSFYIFINKKKKKEEMEKQKKVLDSHNNFLKNFKTGRELYAEMLFKKKNSFT